MPTNSRPAALCIAFVLLAAACTRHAATPAQSATSPAAPPAPAPHAADPALSRDGAAQLAAAFQRAGSESRVEDTTVVVDTHRLTVRVAVLQVLTQSDHTTAGIDVTMDLDGHPAEAFHAGAVALDADSTEAIAHAVREWAVSTAIPIVAALRSAWRASSESPAGTVFTLGPYRVFAGPTGVRGDVPDGWDAVGGELHRAFLDHARDALPAMLGASADAGTTPGGLHALRMVLHLSEGAFATGDCRVDGVESASLCQVARDFAWPAHGGDFILKQFYVLVPAPAP